MPMERDSRSEGREFESRHCILDGHFLCLFEKTEKNRKRGRGLPIKKNIVYYCCRHYMDLYVTLFGNLELGT